MNAEPRVPILCFRVCVCRKRAAVCGQRCAGVVLAPVAYGGSAGRDNIKFWQHILRSKATCAKHVWVTYSNFNWINDVKDGVAASKNWKCLDFQLHAVERVYTEKK